MAPIAPINLANPASIQPVAVPAPSSNPASGEIFQNMFSSAVNTVENFQSQAGKAIQDLLSGANEDVHTPVIKAQEANLSFQLFMQVRNKVVSAYQTVMGMQL
jgi:flagellar hook-basal body complex protein FliE